MKRMIFLLAILCTFLVSEAQRVTVHATNEPAAQVFAELMRQTGKNFVYSTELLHDIRVTVDAKQRPLNHVLDEMFRDTDIDYYIKGHDVILKRRDKPTKKIQERQAHGENIQVQVNVSKPIKLNEIMVVSRLEAPATETVEIGAKKLTADEIVATPALFGESDVIKALHTQPGVNEGMEGLAGMYVHGGNADENLCMLDNVPMYQVNHFAGLNIDPCLHKGILLQILSDIYIIDKTESIHTKRQVQLPE